MSLRNDRHLDIAFLGFLTFSYISSLVLPCTSLQALKTFDTTINHARLTLIKQHLRRLKHSEAFYERYKSVFLRQMASRSTKLK